MKAGELLLAVLRCARAADVARLPLMIATYFVDLETIVHDDGGGARAWMKQQDISYLRDFKRTSSSTR